MQGEVLVNLFVPWSLWDTPRWICAGYQRLFSGSWRKISLTCQECFPYLNTVRSSSDMTVAYCSVGCLPICLLQQTSCLLISWAHSYLRLLFFLPRHFLVQLDLRLLLGRGVIGLGNLGAISFVLILRLLHKHWHFFASLRRKMTFWPCLTFKVGPFTTIYCRQIRNKLEANPFAEIQLNQWTLNMVDPDLSEINFHFDSNWFIYNFSFNAFWGGKVTLC